MKQLSVILISIVTLLISQITGERFYSSDEISHPCQQTITEVDSSQSTTPISILTGSQSRVPSAARRVLSHNSKVCVAQLHHHTIYSSFTAFITGVERCASLLKTSIIFKWHKIRI